MFSVIFFSYLGAEETKVERQLVLYLEQIRFAQAFTSYYLPTT